MVVHLQMGGGGVTQCDASYTMATDGRESLCNIYIFLNHCSCKGNDRSIMKIFSGLAKSTSFWNEYLTWVLEISKMVG